MNKKIFFFTFLLAQSFSLPLKSINLKQYVDQILDGRKQLIDAIKGLKDGKAEISKIYADQLKPQLFDVVDDKIAFVNGKIKDLKDSISPLTDIPSIVTKLVAIGDLESTLQWIIDNPLNKIGSVLNNTKKTFQPIATQLIPPSQDEMDANQNKINEIYVAAAALETPEAQDAKRKEADDFIAQLASQQKAGAMYAKFDLATAKLQSAVCKMEKTLTAMKAQFTPSPECTVPK